MTWSHIGNIFGVREREAALEFQRNRLKKHEEKAIRLIKEKARRIQSDAYTSFEAFYEDYKPTKADLNTEQTLLSWIEDRSVVVRALHAFPDQALSPCALVQLSEMGYTPGSCIV